MANIPTDKFNTTTFITNNAPINYGWAGSKVTLNANGQNLGAIPVDPTTNQAVYQTTVGSQGVQTLGMTFTGGRGYAGGASDSYTSHVGGSAVSQQSVVTQIVAGPGIYISAPNGQGVVTISTSPIPTQLTSDNLYDIRWTITDPDHIPSVGDQSQFTATGLNGINLRSRDGVNFVEMGPPNPYGINLANAVTLQSNELGGDGTVYWSAFINQDQVSHDLISVQSVWGRLANTTTNNIITGDGFNIIGDYFEIGGSTQITGEIVIGCDTFYKSGSFANALHLLSSLEGAIYKVNGLPFHYYNTVTNDGLSSPISVSLEYNDNGNSAIGQSASNLADQTTSSYLVAFACSNGSAGSILHSTRNGNNSGSWTSVSAPYSLGAIAYGNGHWVAAGANDCVGTSSDGINWTWSTSGWPGSLWGAAAYGNGKFVLVGGNGHVVYSTDNGATWKRGQSGTANNLNAIAYSPSLNKFVAVGDLRTIVTVNG